LLTRLTHFFADDRLLANLIAVHVAFGAILAVSFVMRKILLHGGNSLVRWTGLHWLDHVGKEANRRIRTLMFWTTLLALIAAVAIGIVYHVAGRDARTDLAEWYQQLTGTQLLAWGLTLAKLVVLLLVVNFSAGIVRRLLHYLEAHTLRLLH